MKTYSLLTLLLLSLANLPLAVADTITTYSVESDFDDGTSFIGTFNFDSTTNTVTSLSGTLNDSMGDTVTLSNQLPSASQVYDSNGGMLASAYLSTTATPYTESMSNGNSNAFATIDFNITNPTLVTASNINQTVFMDCTPASGMGSSCSTGIKGGGTMGSPQSETISYLSSVSSVPLPSAVWSFLAGILGLLSWSKKRNKT